MIQVVQEYYKYTQLIPHLISKTDYKSSYFIKLLGLKAPTYYRKLRDNAFTSGEVFTLTKALFPKEAYLEEIKADLKMSREDIKSGRVVEHSKVIESIRKDYL